MLLQEVFVYHTAVVCLRGVRESIVFYEKAKYRCMFMLTYLVSSIVLQMYINLRIWILLPRLQRSA